MKQHTFTALLIVFIMEIIYCSDENKYKDSKKQFGVALTRQNRIIYLKNRQSSIQNAIDFENDNIA
jgi:hypothetical protein